MDRLAKKKRSWRRIAIEVAIIVAIFFAFRAWQTRDVVRGVAPALAGQSAEGGELVLTTGEPTLVHFWATWCGVCRAEQGTIHELAKEYRVVTVASQSGSAEDVTRYFEREGVAFPTVVDAGGQLARRWGVNAYPTTFVLDAEGKIRSVEVGYTTSLGLRARLWLARF